MFSPPALSLLIYERSRLLSYGSWSMPRNDESLTSMTFCLMMSDLIGASDLIYGKHEMKRSGAKSVQLTLTIQNQSGVIYLKDSPIALEMKELSD
mmetsp:Transcript_14439/g.22271  ORF Transcript_14439/g.22271 Transcript_14439/m.22271 type:complete len:95 (+) Transcript_14439:202-486(+)